MSSQKRSERMNRPYLEILIQPQSRFRFRYKSEMTGKHGSLFGVVPSSNMSLTEKNICVIQNKLSNDLNSPSRNSVPRHYEGQLNVPHHEPHERPHQLPMSMSHSSQKSTGERSMGRVGPSSSSSFNFKRNTVPHTTSSPGSSAGHGVSPSPVNSSSDGNGAGTSANASTTAGLGGNGAKIYPMVKLHNFPGDAIIRCSLVSETAPYYPHPHILETDLVGGSGWAEETDNSILALGNNFAEIPVSAGNKHTAIFQGLNIIYTGKKVVRKVLGSKLSELGEGDKRKVSLEEIDSLSVNCNLNVVCLYFEAFTRLEESKSPTVDPSSESGTVRRLISICRPIVSDPIHHNKSTQTGDLRIVRIDKHASYCTGDEEVFILVEKVDKHNIQVKFFQESDQGLEIWKAYGKFSKLDVHHQYAIVFKTPPYRSCEIDCEVDVWLQLERPSDGATSQPISFKYKPIERLRKMPKKQVPRSGPDRDPPSSGSAPGNRPQYDFFGQNNPNFPQNFQLDNNPRDENGPSSSSHSVRQGCGQKFPCDFSAVATEAGKSSSANVAFNVALSVGEGLHNWAETSDFDFLLHKLRHLLCLVDENGDNALHAAISNKQREPFIKILNIMTSSPDIMCALNEQNINNQTPVSLAVSMDCPDFVQELIERKVDLSIPNLEGDTPLHLAVKDNNIPCLRALLRAEKIDSVINRFNYSSLTPMHLAVANSNLEALDLICRAGSNLIVQEGTFGTTPLHLAVEKGSITATMLILQAAREADISEIANTQNYRGDTPLHVAASSGLVAITSILLYYGADPTIENFIVKETRDQDEVRVGQTPIDVCSNDKVLQTFDGCMDSWETVVKSCSQLLDTRPEKDHNIFSLDSLQIDSGIDVKDQSVYSSSKLG
ncbi:unnamed protein product [Allacma fusca]|uniref:RHD domain-containing protein n=1 Tax=Allacma fusca TaxID=39272 RepID=A0A8J2JT30_9HEXA|nr:unnamed protein product [Allacma fusca]